MLKNWHLIIFIITILLIGIYLGGQNETEAAKVTIEITKDPSSIENQLNDSELEDIIGNIYINKIFINKLVEPKGNDMIMPGLSVGLFSNKMMVSEWYSVPLNDNRTYEVTLGLTQSINKGDIINIAVYINDNEGNVIIGKRKDVIWN